MARCQRDGNGWLDSNAMAMEQHDGDGWLFSNVTVMDGVMVVQLRCLSRWQRDGNEHTMVMAMDGLAMDGLAMDGSAMDDVKTWQWTA